MNVIRLSGAAMLFVGCHAPASLPVEESGGASSTGCPATLAELRRLPVEQEQGAEQEEAARGSVPAAPCEYPETSCVVFHQCHGTGVSRDVSWRCGSNPASDTCPATEPRPESPCTMRPDRSCFFGAGCGFTEYTCQSGLWRANMLGGGYPP